MISSHRSVIGLFFCAALMLCAATPTTVTRPTPSAAPTNSPNEALAAMAKEVLLKSLPPVYEKRENWGHQKEVVDRFQWVQRNGHWNLEKQTRLVNDGLWRMYKIRIEDAQRKLQLRFTQPHAAENGRTAFQVFLTARLGIEARQEQWRLGIKGLNFHIEGDATIDARLDIVVGVQPVPSAGFGTIEVQPVVTAINLRLVDLTLKKVDLIYGDLARELGHAFEDILAGELHKREGKVAKNLNAEIKKHEDKLRFSPTQIAEIGWEKIQSILGAATAMKSDEPKSQSAPSALPASDH